MHAVLLMTETLREHSEPACCLHVGGVSACRTLDVLKDEGACGLQLETLAFVDADLSIIVLLR